MSDTFTIEIVRAGDSLYNEVCKKATEIYKEVLGIEPLSFPYVFIAVLKNGKPIGSVGIWHGYEVEQLVVEQFCEADPEKKEEILVKYSATQRQHIAEATCLNVEREYRDVVTTVLMGHVFQYLYYIKNIRVLLIIQASTIKKPFMKMGVDWFTVCKADPDFFKGSDKKKEDLKKIYFKRLRPVCTAVNVSQAIRAFECWHEAQLDLKIERGFTFETLIRISKEGGCL